MTPNKKTAVVLFSGGGGVEAGLIDAGIEPLLAVEYNPNKPVLSKAMADCHEKNFPNCKVIRRTVQELAAENFSEFPQEPDILWASPMCSNFSIGKKNGAEQDDDVEAAKAVVVAIKKLRPKHFILENVLAYRKSKSWRIIETALTALGFGCSIKTKTVDMSDYGIPQARKRMIAWASQDNQVSLEMPSKTAKTSWYEAIEDLIPNLPNSKLTKGQHAGVSKFLEENNPEPLLIWASRPDRPIPSSSTTNTILRSQFTDGKGYNRSKFADIWFPDGTIKQLTIECVRRLQSFPDWYKFPESVAVAGSILGYSVPPKFVEQFLKPIAQTVSTYAWIKPEEIDWSRTQPRAWTNQQAIQSYAELMSLGLWDWTNTSGNHELPLLFINDDGECYPAIGHHRGLAAKSLGEKIYCEIRKGTRLQALIAATQSNKNPQLPLTAADKKHALKEIFQGLIEEYGTIQTIPWASDGKYQDKGVYSSRKIAKWIGVSNKTVATYKNELLLTVQITQLKQSYQSGQRFEITKSLNSLLAGSTGTWNGGFDSKQGLLIDFDYGVAQHVHPSILNPTNKPAPTEMEETVNVEPETFSKLSYPPNNANNAQGNNGNRHHKPQKIPMPAPIQDYVIGFLTNLDQMSPDQLVEVRDRINQRLIALKSKKMVPFSKKSASA